MSSDYYGGIAGEQADQGAAAEAAFEEWLDDFARREAGPTYEDDLRAAFKWWTEMVRQHGVRWWPSGHPATEQGDGT